MMKQQQGPRTPSRQQRHGAGAHAPADPRTPPSGFSSVPTQTRTRAQTRTITPQSPAQSIGADTYTTISLSQSYAKEFEEENIENEQFLFLDRLASEQQQLVSLSSTTTSTGSTASTTASSTTNTNGDNNNSNNNNNSTTSTSTSTRNSGSPFRRLRQRATNDDPIHEDEKKEEQEDVVAVVLPMMLEFDENSKPSSSSRKSGSKGGSSSSDNDEEFNNNNNNNNSAYRYLIRMNTQNYRHQSLSYGGGCGGGVEESKACEDIDSSSASVSVSLSSSVLLPLHPHQRIIASLPQDSSFSDDHSGYTYFRDSIQRQRFSSAAAPVDLQQPIFSEV
jgi:hypothetical protein